MAQSFKEKGVVLQKIPYADSDEIVTVLFEKSGVKKLFAKGSKASKKRFLGGLDHFECFEFDYAAKAQGLGYILSAQDLPRATSSAQMRGHLLSYAFLNYFSELIREFFWEEARADDVYNLWQDLFNHLLTSALENHIAIAYTLKLCSLAGYDGKRDEGLQNLIKAYESEPELGHQKLGQIFSYPEKLLQRSLKTLPFMLSQL